MLALRVLDGLNRRGQRDPMRLAVVQNHELHHGCKTAPFLFRRCDQGSLHVWWNPDADNFGFCDSQGWLLCGNTSVLRSVSGHWRALDLPPLGVTANL